MLDDILKRGPPSRNACDRVLVVKVFDNAPLPTAGDYTAFSYIDFPPDVQELIQTWGPWCNSITAQTQNLARTSAHSWKVSFYKSFDGVSWSSSPTDLFSVITANGIAVQTPYTTTSDFTLQMRWVVAVKNTGTATTLETATGSLALVFDLKT